MNILKSILISCFVISLFISCGGDDKTIIDDEDPNGGGNSGGGTEQPVTPADPKWWGTEVIAPTLADSAFCYYNRAFLLDRLNSKDGRIYYRHQQGTKDWSYYWNHALIILMVEDRYQCVGDESVKPLLSELLYSFLEHEKNPATNDTHDWTWNIFTDDLLWAGLAFIRGYQITGEPRFLEQAEWDWNHLYKQAYDNTYGGGLWWSVNKESKSGLSNNPAVSMACYLYEATGKEMYLQRAKELFEWLYTHLYQPTGGVDENISGPEPGKLTNSYNVYNIGAFVEACNALYQITKEPIYAETAKQCIKYVMTECVTNEGIMSAHRYDGSWESEFSRGMGLFVHENNLWNYKTTYTKDRKPITYYDWMKLNATLSWKRRNNDNLTWNEWAVRTPDAPVDAPLKRKVWSALEMVSMVVMNQVTPETNPMGTFGGIKKNEARLED